MDSAVLFSEDWEKNPNEITYQLPPPPLLRRPPLGFQLHLQTDERSPHFLQIHSDSEKQCTWTHLDVLFPIDVHVDHWAEPNQAVPHPHAAPPVARNEVRTNLCHWCWRGTRYVQFYNIIIDKCNYCISFFFISGASAWSSWRRLIEEQYVFSFRLQKRRTIVVWKHW